MSRPRYQRLKSVLNNGESAVFVEGADGGRPIIVRSPADKWLLAFDLFGAMSWSDKQEAAKRMAMLTAVRPAPLRGRP